MKYRKLRIAWSVAWGVLCLLLIVLWVRSYWVCDIFCIRLGYPINQWMQSHDGGLMYDPSANLVQSEFFKWITHPAAEFRNHEVITPSTSPVLGFRWSKGIKTRAVIPHWFLTSVFFGLAATPWLPWRFSLRTLLIGMTVAAIGLGWIIYEIRK